MPSYPSRFLSPPHPHLHSIHVENAHYKAIVLETPLILKKAKMFFTSRLQRVHKAISHSVIKYVEFDIILVCYILGVLLA